MTTFRSKRLSVSDVSYHDNSSSEPDAVGVEIQASGEIVFDVMRERDGTTTVCFGTVPKGFSGWEIEVADFSQMLGRAMSTIDDWEANLRQGGSIWSEQE
jgi:hypothetical protein